MYKAEILALKDIGEGLLSTSGGSQLQMGITSMKKEYLWGLVLALGLRIILLWESQMRIGMMGENWWGYTRIIIQYTVADFQFN